MSKHLLSMFLTILCVITIVGCKDGFLTFSWDSKKSDADVEEGFVDAQLDGLPDSLAYQDTIAEQGWIEGLRLMKVRGYGVVAGLGTRGSRECPRQIRSQLIQEMYKRKEFAGTGLKPARLTPEAFLDDLDTAVVAVEAEIPAAAAKEQIFDVAVWAIAGTQTTSLEGGRLYTTNLHIYNETSPATAVRGKALATAAGPIFINPFAASEDAATARNPREGTIIGGGTALEPRRIRFVLSRPSYQQARAITSAINARFGGTDKVAIANSPSHVNLRVPPQYADDPFHFMALMRHLYIPQHQGFVDKRAKDLAQEMLKESAPHADIALAWEGIGRTVIPVLQGLYATDEAHARFYSALAGFRLGDDMAVEVLASFAEDPISRYRITAIEELGRDNHSFRASAILRNLLNDSDPRIRVEAFEQLLARNDTAIETTDIARGTFSLDRAQSTAENLIYVRRSGRPRIALLGSGLKCLPPIFYSSPNEMITINAPDEADELTIIRKTPFGNRTSPAIGCSLELSALITMLGDNPQLDSKGKVKGLAVDYSTITHALHALCQSGSVNAKFMLQRPSSIDMFGPIESSGRKESDL